MQFNNCVAETGEVVLVEGLEGEAVGVVGEDEELLKGNIMSIDDEVLLGG